jgi:hypothetical protein
MSGLNELLQNQIAIFVLNLKEDEDTEDMLKLSIVILDLLFKSNRRVGRVAAGDFINETCSNNLNLRFIAQQYFTKKKKSKKGRETEKFVFLDYPWLFSTEAKVEAIQQESKFAMNNEISEQITQGMLQGGFDMDLLANTSLNVTVRRSDILGDALKMLSGQSKHLRKELRVKFQGEEGIDLGGVKKEFFQLLIKELFNPDYAMFDSKHQGRFYWFNKLSFECSVNFELIGTLLALAIYNSVLLSIPLPKVVYKKLLGEPLELTVSLCNRRTWRSSNQSSTQPFETSAAWRRAWRIWT